MELAPWHVPLLVMAGIILLGVVIELTLLRSVSAVVRRLLGAASLGVIATLLLVALVVAAIGPSLADQLASVAAAIAGIVAVWLTYRLRVPSSASPSNDSPSSDSLSEESPSSDSAVGGQRAAPDQRTESGPEPSRDQKAG